MLIGRTFDYPNPIRPTAAPHRGKVVEVRNTPTETLVLLEGKRVFVPLMKCTEVRS